MLKFTAETADPNAIAQELLHGKGAVLLSGLFLDAQIAEARQIIHDHSGQADTVTHFQGQAAEDGNLNLQRRVWNLLAKGDVFADMAAHPVLMKVLRKFLGTEFIMGSIAANRILPGGPGQEPHVDYPYWDFYKAETHPIGLNASFPMNAQVSILLDPFTAQTGATAYLPGSQKELRYPTEEDDFYKNCERMLGAPGDVALFFGAAWHCAMPNTSDIDRSAVLINYAPKWLTPIEEMHAALPEGFLDTASDDLRQLLGHNYPHPQAFDKVAAQNAIGRK
jgi:ectoine hydroxylase-related dioxygenase (phytanoyl-CoA dioxygenase family)